MKTSTSLQDYNNKLDLEPIVFSLTKAEDGPGWSLEKARSTEKWYRRFLYLVSLYPKQGLVPTKDLDIFWHTHILDTQKYMNDCEKLFGGYFHHFPYFGLRGKEDRKNLEQAFKDTEELFIRHFDASPRNYEVTDCGALCNEPTPKYETKYLNSQIRPTITSDVL